MAGGDTTHLSSLQLSVVIDSDGPPDYQSVRRTEIIILTAQLPPHDHHHVTPRHVTSLMGIRKTTNNNRERYFAGRPALYNYSPGSSP